MRFVFDVEANDFLEKATKVHSLVIQDLDTGELWSFADHPNWPSITQGLHKLGMADEIFGHNIITFDLPLLERLHGFKTKQRARDTYVMATWMYAHIKDLDFSGVTQIDPKYWGKHGLDAWGARLKHPCIEFDGPWETWTPLMQAYCEQDVRTNTVLAKHLLTREVHEAEETESELRKYLFVQEQNGFPFDFEKAIKLQGRLATERETIAQELIAEFGSWQAPDGKPFIPKRTQVRLGVQYTAGVPFQRMKTVQFNPGSRDHIAKILMERFGWTPTEKTDGGKPKVDVDTLEGLDEEKYPIVSRVRRYLFLSKRLGQLAEGKSAWLLKIQEHPVTRLHHLHGAVLQNGTITHRATHLEPNMSQVPAEHEYRELFMVPDGWCIVGSDASGLELRCLAHFMARHDGGEYAKVVLAEKPNDVHTMHANLLGISRDTAKTFIYAFIYGAGNEKLGKILGATSPNRAKKLGAKTRAAFLEKLPALAALTKDVARAAANRGYFRGIDGRRVYIRAKHSALNTLLQHTGSIICKRWIVDFSRTLYETLGEPGWTGRWTPLVWSHDEVQIAVRDEYANSVRSVLLDSIRSMTQHFNFRLPLDGEARIGNTWAETH